MKRNFPKELLQQWDIPWGSDVLSDEVWDTGRWQEWHAAVFRAPDDGRLWRVIYAQMTGDLHEMDPWDEDDPNVNSDGTVTGEEVEPVEVTTTEYRAVKE